MYEDIDKKPGQTVAIEVIDAKCADDAVDNITQEISLLSARLAVLDEVLRQLFEGR